MNDLLIECWDINSSVLIVDYFLNEKYSAESFPVETFEVFCVANGLLDWHYHFQKMGDWDEAEGTHEFWTWAKEKCTDEEILLFLKAHVKHT